MYTDVYACLPCVVYSTIHLVNKQQKGMKVVAGMHPYIVFEAHMASLLQATLVYNCRMYLSLDTQHKHTFTIKDRRQKIIMAQTVVVALCIAAAVAAAASVPSASASDQTTAMHLLPVEAAEVLTKGRAGGVQRELLDESWVRDADEARSGVAGIQSQRELLGESWVGGAERPGPGSPASRPRGNSPPPTPSQPLPRNCSQWEQRKS